MDYYSKLTDEQWRTLQDAADLLGLLRDQQLHSAAPSKSRPGEQYQVSQNHPPDASWAWIAELAPQRQELLIGSHHWLPPLPPLTGTVPPEGNLFQTSTWSGVYAPLLSGDILNPSSVPLPELPYQPQLNGLFPDTISSSLSNGFSFAFGDFGLAQHIPRDPKPFSTPLYQQNRPPAAKKATSKSMQQTTAAQPPADLTAQNTPTSPSSTHGIVPRRRRFSPEDRAQTVSTRKRRACMQCRQNRKRCPPDEYNPDPDAWCLCCLERSTLDTIGRLPCLRRKIIDSVLFRNTGHRPCLDPFALTGPDYGGFRIPKIWVANSPVKKLILSQGHGTFLHLRVREFQPPQGDNGLLDSRGRGIYAVPWALADAEDALSSVLAFLEESVDAYLDQHTKDFDEISQLVFIAVRDSSRSSSFEERTLFRDLLRFWTAARFIEGGWRCEGPEKLNADKLPDPLNPPRLVAPPPFVDFQLAAVVMERVLKPLQERILSALEKLVFTGRARNWFRIFLVTFVLLQGYELAFAHEVAWTRKRRYPTRYVDANRVLGFYEGAKILLVHFHHMCKGSVPFRIDFDWSDPSARSMADLNAAELNLVQTLIAKRQEMEHDVHISRVSDRTDRPLWFSGQMFEAGWMPTGIDVHAQPV